jgi:prevent-host-death family protein
MEKIISSFEVRRSFGRILQDILTRRDKFIVDRHGTPVAVVVPIEVYEQWKQSRERFFETLRRAQATANLGEEEASKLADEAVKAVRSLRCSLPFCRKNPSRPTLSFLQIVGAPTRGRPTTFQELTGIK